MQRPTKTPPKLDWGDANAVREWARGIITQARDAISAGEDATRAPSARELGRRAARRIITEADEALGALVESAGFTPKRRAEPRHKRGAR